MPFTPEQMIDVATALRHATYDGAIWSVNCEQLNVNLMRLVTGASVTAHVNDELDVILVVFEGQGELELDAQQFSLGPGMVFVIPRGMRRAIRCTHGPLAYLLAHRQRGGLMPR